MFSKTDDTHIMGDKTKQCTADILIPHERTISSFLSHTVCMVDGKELHTFRLDVFS